MFVLSTILFVLLLTNVRFVENFVCFVKNFVCFVEDSLSVVGRRESVCFLCQLTLLLSSFLGRGCTVNEFTYLPDCSVNKYLCCCTVKSPNKAAMRYEFLKFVVMKKIVFISIFTTEIGGRRS